MVGRHHGRRRFPDGRHGGVDRGALQLPCLMLVANNRSFYNDELHQERVAKERGRPVENKWIGQRIDEPDIDLAAMARAQGAVGIGPVKQLSELKSADRRGHRARQERARCAWSTCACVPGYDTNMSGARRAARRGADWHRRSRTASSAGSGRARCSRGRASGSSTRRSAGWSTRSPARARCSAR